MVLVYTLLAKTSSVNFITLLTTVGLQETLAGDFIP